METKQLLAVLTGPTCYDPDSPAGDGGTMGGNGEFLDVWNGVPVSSSDIVDAVKRDLARLPLRGLCTYVQETSTVVA